MRFTIALTLAAVGIAFWSTNALAGSTALEVLPLSLVTFLQFSAATAVLATAVVLRALRRHGAPTATAGAQVGRPTDWWFAARLGVLGYTGTMLLQYVGFAYAPIAESNIVAYAWPMFAAVALAAMTRSRSALIGLGLAVVGFAGVALMIFAQGGLSGGGSIVGYGAALLSAICMAYYSLGSGRGKAPALEVMLLGGITGTLISLPAALLGAVPWTPNWSWLAVLYTGIGPCAAGYLAWSAAMRRTQGRLAPLGYATPLLSTLVLLAAGRSFGGPLAVAGATLVLACTIGVVVNDRLTGRSAL